MINFIFDVMVTLKKFLEKDGGVKIELAMHLPVFSLLPIHMNFT